MQTKIIEVPVRQVIEVPSELTELCKVKTHERSERYTYGDVITYLVEALGTITDCNKKLGSIKELGDGQ